MRLQTTPHILMVRPANFAFNAETAENNAFQSRDGALSADEMRTRALAEFDGFVELLRGAGVHVVVAEDTPSPARPDAVFPNNWVTFHQEGLVVTYPMYASSRRIERREDIIELVKSAGFSVNRRLNLEKSEQDGIYLEGTGSIIFDHRNHLAYACLSPRTSADLLEQLCAELDYRKVVFHAVDSNGQEIYHTNVMMALGETFVVICLDSVRDPQDRSMLEELFRSTGKEIVDITLEQMNQFAGNMLQVQNDAGNRILVMSETARKSLNPEQIDRLQAHTRLLAVPIDTIERYGGGSARCMMAEIMM